MYYLQGSFVAKEGKRDELAEILLEAARLVGQVGGCHLYLVSTKEGDPTSVFVTEVWDDQSAQEASLQNAEIRALIGQAMPIIDSVSDNRLELETIGGLGL